MYGEQHLHITQVHYENVIRFLQKKILELSPFSTGQNYSSTKEKIIKIKDKIILSGIVKLHKLLKETNALMEMHYLV